MDIISAITTQSGSQMDRKTLAGIISNSCSTQEQVNNFRPLDWKTTILALSGPKNLDTNVITILRLSANSPIPDASIKSSTPYRTSHGGIVLRGNRMHFKRSNSGRFARRNESEKK